MSQKSNNVFGDAVDRAGDANYLKLQQSRVTHTLLNEISQILNTGLSIESLDVCIKLIEAGVHPQALAEVIMQIRREINTVHNQQNSS